MNTFNSVYRLTEVIKSAAGHCLGLGSHLLSPEYHTRMLPVILVDFEHALEIPACESIPEITANRVHYRRKFLTVFLCSTEYCDQEGKGAYGIGMYSGNGSSWRCDSILFDDTSHEPLLANGRDAAMKIATSEAQSHDKSNARRNENIVLEHGLMEGPTLNAVLGTLLRAEPESVPATIGIRARKIQLLLEGDNENGQPLSVPRDGFVCRDEAAGAILQAIAYTTDTACQKRRDPLEQVHATRRFAIA